MGGEKMECCNPRSFALKLLIVGIVLVLVRLYTEWDIWVVLGVILIIKAILLFVMPRSDCDMPNVKTKKKK